jgi:hypothetical protein
MGAILQPSCFTPQQNVVPGDSDSSINLMIFAGGKP